MALCTSPLLCIEDIVTIHAESQSLAKLTQHTYETQLTSFLTICKLLRRILGGRLLWLLTHVRLSEPLESSPSGHKMLSQGEGGLGALGGGSTYNIISDNYTCLNTTRGPSTRVNFFIEKLKQTRRVCFGSSCARVHERTDRRKLTDRNSNTATAAAKHIVYSVH